MINWLYHHKDFVSILASVATIISLFWVWLAAIASRKQNILKDAPNFVLTFEQSGISVKNLNNKFAYDLESEAFYVLDANQGATNFFKPFTDVYKLKFKGSNYMAPADSVRELTLLKNGERVNDRMEHFLYSKLLESINGGIHLFYKDSHGYRFFTKVRSTQGVEKRGTYWSMIDQVNYEIVKTPKYVPRYNLVFWIRFFIDRTCRTYFMLFFGNIYRAYIVESGRKISR